MFFSAKTPEPDDSDDDLPNPAKESKTLLKKLVKNLNYAGGGQSRYLCRAKPGTSFYLPQPNAPAAAAPARRGGSPLCLCKSQSQTRDSDTLPKTRLENRQNSISSLAGDNHSTHPKSASS